MKKALYLTIVCIAILSSCSHPHDITNNYIIDNTSYKVVPQDYDYTKENGNFVQKWVYVDFEEWHGLPYDTEEYYIESSVKSIRKWMQNNDKTPSPSKELIAKVEKLNKGKIKNYSSSKTIERFALLTDVAFRCNFDKVDDATYITVIKYLSPWKIALIRHDLSAYNGFEIVNYNKD